MDSSNLKSERQSNEDLIPLRLYCWNCDAAECEYARKYSYQDSLYGCTRWVSEEVAAQYIHYREEVIPYWPQYSSDWVNDSYFEIYNFLQNQIYNQPLAAKFDNKGEIISKRI